MQIVLRIYWFATRYIINPLNYYEIMGNKLQTIVLLKEYYM